MQNRAITYLQGKEQGTLFAELSTSFYRSVREISEGPIVVALPGGRSIVGFLRVLLTEAEALPKSYWSRMQFFLVDERCVPLTDGESNYRLLNDGFFAPLSELNLIGAEQIHPFDIGGGEAELVAERYTEQLYSVGGAFHFVFLGVGEDGHIASLFPGHSSVTESGSAFLIERNSPKPPPLRVSASPDLIRSAKWGALFFFGEGKREALDSFQRKGATELECPARIALELPELHVVTDLE